MLGKLIFILIIFSSPSYIIAQCCSPGGPTVGSLSSGTVWKNNLKFTTYYQYGISADYRDGSSISDFDLLNKGYYNFIGILASYGVTNNFTLTLESGYYITKTQDYNLDVSDNILEGFGLTELTILPKYSILNAIDNYFDLSFGLGIKIPFTREQQLSNNVVLPIDVQPSSNALGFISDLYLNYPLNYNDLQLMLFNRIDMNTDTDFIGTKYTNGTRVATSINMLYGISDKFSSLYQLKHEFRAQDKRDNKLIDASGYNIFFISTQIIYLFDELIQTSLLFDYPLYENYNGVQLSIDYKVSFAMTYNLRF